MDLAALDRGVGAEGAANDFAQRLGAVDDEQAADLRVEPALDQIVDQRLDDSGIFGLSTRPSGCLSPLPSHPEPIGSRRQRRSVFFNIRRDIGEFPRRTLCRCRSDGATSVVIGQNHGEDERGDGVEPQPNRSRVAFA
jgi:hypothetical protein